MANALEMTFKNLQSDERYKKLERTLKMALLKNAERRSSDNGNAGAWPNVSSINGDHLDSSLAAVSVHSSRISSEVVSSSTNLRNILLNKQQFGGARNNVATSSENQFPTSKNIDDSAMMPPPRTPGVCFGGTKRFAGENRRVPLLNMPVSSGRNTNGFSVSTPASSISSIPKCMGTASVDTSTVFQENNGYHGRNGYEEAENRGAQKQERNFSRWRVLLNDKGLLIIKGTLDCGKVARSKPVIRRLTPTSVQSIFKHTYHLQGNLVDERDELPDYVRGKFYNGFPDDWENVYQVWRNFVNDGNRLSFRWPTAVTDSDDDIKSGITEITYRPERRKKSVSPRKRNRSAKSSSSLSLSSAVGAENRPESNSCSCSHNSSSGTQEKSSRNKNTPPASLSQSHSKNNLHQDSCKADETLDEKSKSHENSAGSLNTTDKNSVNTLANYLSEDKFNTIIDNLTDKNCPLEYIQKIVQMFDCMKYVASYQSSGENEPDKDAALSGLKEASRSPKKKNRSTEEKNGSTEKKSDVEISSSSKSRVNTPRPSTQKLNQYEDQPPPAGGVSVIGEKSLEDRDRKTRRQLTKRDYESSESDDDFYDDTRRSSTQRFPSSNERLEKTRKKKNPADSVASRTSREYTELGKLSNDPRRRYAETPTPRNQSHDSSISDEEFTVKRKREPKLGNRAQATPGKNAAPGKENQREKYYDSSISITEDESRYPDTAKVEDMRKENYDSSVSITEDEHGGSNARNRMNSRKYYAEPNSHSVESQTRRNGNSRDDRKRNDLNYYSETKSRLLEQSVAGNGDNRNVRKRLDSLDYYPETNSRHSEEGKSRVGDIRDGRKRLDSLDYYSDSHSHSVDQDVVKKSGNVPDDRKRQDFLPGAQDICRNNSFRNSRVIRTTAVSQNPRAGGDEIVLAATPNSTSNVHAMTPNSKANNSANKEEADSSYWSADVKRWKKSNTNRELTEIQSSEPYAENHSRQQKFERSSESPETPSPENKALQVRQKSNTKIIKALNLVVTELESQTEYVARPKHPEIPPPKSKTPQVKRKANASREPRDIESQSEFEESPESPKKPPAKNKTPQVRRKANANRELTNIETQPEFEENPESPEKPTPKSKTPQVRRKATTNRELTDIESQSEFEENPKSPEKPLPKSKTPRVRRKATTNRELTDIESQPEFEDNPESPAKPPPKSKTPRVRRKVNANRELSDMESQSEFEQNPESPENPPPKGKTPQVRRKANTNRELTEIEPQDFGGSPESPEMKSKTAQVRKKPIVIRTETVNINLNAYNRQKINGRKEIDKKAGNTPRKRFDGPKASNAIQNDPIGQKSPVNLPEPAEPVKPNTRSKEALGAPKVQDGKSFARENQTENAANSESSAIIASAAEYGSEKNPKLLTAWVPAVICDDEGDKKCHLIFEGKLLNEAGHVADRKFVTEVVRRRLSPKIIETVSQEFYKLVGDLNDTKHVVPKELIKLCHSGCPGRIGQFCERWKSLTGEIYKSPPQDRPHNTTVDCLSVPRSSRGRRILPPLNYWSGERMITKDNQTMYSPGNSQESSIPSSLENTSQEVRRKKRSPKARPETKRTIESAATETKKKEAEKISTASKSTAESPPQPARDSQRTRAGKRRLSRNLQVSSSESDDDAEVKPTPRKRKSKVNNNDPNTQSTRKLRNSGKNAASPQSPEHANIGSKKGSYEKSAGPEFKSKKRQKIDDNQSTLQQYVTRRPSEVKCTYVKNVPMRDGDLSEDQLSTM